MFSPGANAVLREFVDQDDPNENLPDYLDTRLAAGRKCLTRLVECSKEDLKLKKSWLERIV